jgi:hypothetical protein
MARAAGKNGAVYVSPSGSTTPSPVLNLTKWTIDRSTGTIEVTSFGDSNKVYLQDLPDLKGTLTGFWDSAVDPLYVAGSAADGTNMYLYPDRLNSPQHYDYGPAWLNTTADVDVKGAVLVTATFLARGSWGHY